MVTTNTWSFRLHNIDYELKTLTKYKPLKYYLLVPYNTVTIVWQRLAIPGQDMRNLYI